MPKPSMERLAKTAIRDPAGVDVCELRQGFSDAMRKPGSWRAQYFLAKALGYRGEAADVTFVYEHLRTCSATHEPMARLGMGAAMARLTHRWGLTQDHILPVFALHDDHAETGIFESMALCPLVPAGTLETICCTYLTTGGRLPAEDWRMIWLLRAVAVWKVDAYRQHANNLKPKVAVAGDHVRMAFEDAQSGTVRRWSAL